LRLFQPDRQRRGDVFHHPLSVDTVRQTAGGPG
jgi:hypothetical protein